MRLIDADALELSICAEVQGTRKFCFPCREVFDAIKAQPTIPSAKPEIVRCKDCKYYVIHTLFGRSQAWCERLCDEFDKSLAHGVESDDYCSRAERRTDE